MAPLRHASRPRPRHTVRSQRPHAPAHGVTWEVSTFLLVGAAIAALFLIAMLYLSQATTVATRGYQAQRLEQLRDELRRQNALLEVENARLDSPVRIELEATKLGLVRAAQVPVVRVDPISATR